MAKTWVTQKRLKEKKFREKSRGVMKSYSSEKVSCGASPNREVMEWYKNSAKSLGWNWRFQDVSRYNVNAPRAEALKTLDKIKNECPEWLYFRLPDDGSFWARMYFCFNPEQCCVLEFSNRTKVLRRSIVYRNRDVCHQRWLNGSIDWVESGSVYHKNIPVTYIDS